MLLQVSAHSQLLLKRFNSEMSADKDELQQMEMELEIRGSYKMSNSLVSKCFDQCVKDFKTKNLTDKETLCVSRCTDKFIKMSQAMGRVSAEQGQIFSVTSSIPTNTKLNQEEAR